MKPVYQTLVCKDKGNCFQACLASLFHTDIGDTINIIDHPVDSWHFHFADWISKQGWDWVGSIDADLISSTSGVGGYYLASVPSKNFDGCYHAVIIDSDCNVVHDPDPSGKWLDQNVSAVADYIYNFNKA